MATRKSEMKRVSRKLSKLLDDIAKKNDMKNTKAGELLADFYLSHRKNKKTIEKIRREINF